MSLFTPIIANPPQVKRVQWNPADATARIVYSNGNLTVSHDGSGGGPAAVRATRGHATGKYYFECVYNDYGSSNSPNWGIVSGAYSIAAYVADNVVGNSAGSGWGFVLASPTSNPPLFLNGAGGTVGPTGTAPAVNDVGQCAWDSDAGKIWFGLNNTWYASGNPSAGTNPIFTGLTGTLYPVVCLSFGAAASKMTAHFIAKEFAFAAPTGFLQV